MRRAPKVDTLLTSKSGIALVVVLGFLAVLVIIGVSFAIVMRTERLASRSFSDTVRARQIARLGLERAIADVDDDLKSIPQPSWVDFSMGKAASTDPGADLLTPGTLRYIPRALGFSTNTVLYKYKEIVPPTGDGAIFTGRYAYVVLNCSDLLDANQIGGSARTNGSNPREIQLSTAVLTELSSANLPALRDQYWKRFESVPDILAVSKSSGKGDFLLSNASVSNFFIYSRAPQLLWHADTKTNSTPVYVGSETNLIDWLKVQNAFVEMGAPNASELALALRDYIDDDFWPATVTNATVEPTPLINEIVIDQRRPHDLTNEVRVRVEMWYPFVGITNPHTYRLDLQVRFTDADPSSYNPLISGQFLLPGPWTSPRFEVVFTNAFASDSTDLPVSLASMKARVGARLSESSSQSGGAHVDLVDYSFPIDYATLSVGPDWHAGGAAVRDPRLNHVSNMWSRVSGSDISMGGFNTSVANPAPGDGPDATNMYIRNASPRTTGELGMLFDGVPWRTIRLLGLDALPVLDYFTVFTNAYRDGLVSYSAYPEVIASALLGARPSRWPGDTAKAGLDASAALELANQLYQDYGDSGGGFTKPSELQYSSSGASYLDFSAIESEGLVREFSDLFTVRQQMFTIVVEGEVLGATGEPLASQKALAVLWRDPFPDNSGRNEQFVRFFKWLREGE